MESGDLDLSLRHLSINKLPLIIAGRFETDEIKALCDKVGQLERLASRFEALKAVAIIEALMWFSPEYNTVDALMDYLLLQEGISEDHVSRNQTAEKLMVLRRLDHQFSQSQASSELIRQLFLALIDDMYVIVIRLIGLFMTYNIKKFP